MLEQASGNPHLIMFTSNQKLEKLRQQEEEQTGVKSMKTMLFEQERMRKLQREGKLNKQEEEQYLMSQNAAVIK